MAAPAESTSTPSPDPLFTPLARDATLTARVTSQIKGLIVEGHLLPGQRLPSERELAARFDVSRTVVREAVRGLAAQGLLDVRAGSGSVIRSLSAGDVAQSMALFLGVGRPDFDPDKILEVRRLLEVEIAGLAAARRTEEDLAALEQILAETPRVGNDGDRWLRNDIAFHALLAQATHNELFSLLLNSIADAMAAVRRLGFSVGDPAGRTLRYHGAILDAVRLGDAGRARAAMADHLAEAEETLHVALARDDKASTQSREGAKVRKGYTQP